MTQYQLNNFQGAIIAAGAIFEVLFLRYGIPAWNNFRGEKDTQKKKDHLAICLVALTFMVLGLGLILGSGYIVEYVAHDMF